MQRGAGIMRTGTDRKPKLWGPAVDMSGVDAENALTKTFETEGGKTANRPRAPILRLRGMG
jgi:hypothetical protein